MHNAEPRPPVDEFEESGHAFQREDAYKKLWRNVAVLSISFALALCGLAGCGNDQSKNNESESSTASSAQALAAYEVDVPEWLITTREELDQADALTVSFDASERLQEAGARLAASGAGAFVINRLIGKQVFKKMAEKLAAKLGVSATAKIASVGLVAAGPLGIILKIGADLATTVVLDNLLLMADEAQNRDNFKQELVASINEQRDEMLSLLEPPQPDAQPASG